ncbi:MtrAB system accessory lipoprotein LpqB [Corynebacterium epidermidicanis]|uniref:Lipoprotein LpqB n=1 Tax=Corynebacterium epidermidicanis TaxID=1050174 RepID=A0A0G3GN07_9CORY|nr:MtrAB system accessory lipoprotein LpqB [Corynebacterium epidermidicanis]AKK02534.1 sporulation/spore germination protein [Corynebacterium epidermidicanis]
MAPRIWQRLCAPACVASLVLASCTSLPSDSAPQALRTYVPASPTEDNIKPAAGQEPDLLLRDFFTASVKPTQRHQQARTFLTAEMAKNWDSQANTLILDRIDINSAGVAEKDKRSFNVRGTVVGSLGPGGVYSPENGAYEATITMERIDGEWRISGLPPGVAIERSELRNNYQPYNLYFLDSLDKTLVGDRRWVYNGNVSVDTALLSLLLEGPQKQLAGGVKTYLPAGATFSGVRQGVYSFSGFGDLGEEGRYRFAAQVAWTLARAGVPGPYNVQVDGTPILENTRRLDLEDVAEFNPGASAGAGSPLHGLGNGAMVKVDASGTVPVAGELGLARDIESADLEARSNLVAAVRTTGENDEKRSKLLVGELGGAMKESVEAKTLSRPSFEPAGAGVWTVLDGRKIARIARSSSTGELSQTEVDSNGFAGIEGLISVLRLSYTGVRVAVIINGRVYLGVVEHPSPGQYKVANVRELAPTIGGTALTLDWQIDGSLVVGTSDRETPVWHLQSDGSALTALPSSNIAAPVVAISASSTAIYATDSRSVLQLPVNATSNAFWREVPGLQGQRLAPVVAK